MATSSSSSAVYIAAGAKARASSDNVVYLSSPRVTVVLPGNATAQEVDIDQGWMLVRTISGHMHVIQLPPGVAGLDDDDDEDYTLVVMMATEAGPVQLLPVGSNTHYHRNTYDRIIRDTRIISFPPGTVEVCRCRDGYLFRRIEKQTAVICRYRQDQRTTETVAVELLSSTGSRGTSLQCFFNHTDMKLAVVRTAEATTYSQLTWNKNTEEFELYDPPTAAKVYHHFHERELEEGEIEEEAPLRKRAKLVAVA